MNSDDLFRKLISGTKFDFKKFEKDAKKFMIIKKNSIKSIETNDGISLEDKQLIDNKISDDLDINECESENKLNSKKSKRKTREKLIELENERINHFRKVNKIYVNGTDISPPFESFNDMKLEESILKNIEKSGFISPTPIQMQTISLMFDKREIIGCAPTGSGKTLAFLLPIIHQLKRPQKSGFRAIILAPTRELAKQIHRECLWISNGTGLRVHVIKNVNLAQKKFGFNSGLKYDILVTTPNRLVWLLKQEPKAINIQNIEWLVIDECDKLFESGFRDQLSVIFNSCNESSKLRHAMFSATYDVELEKWAKMNLDNVLTVIIGGKNKAAEVVDQKLTFVGNEQGKLIALRDLISNGCQAPVLIFVETKDKAKRLFNELIYDGVNVDIIHSDRSQLQRDNIVRSFRDGKVWFLICTELMGRGIDFKGVNLVINYDFPSSAVSYIHRIGRTGRAGRRGESITFFTHNDSENLRSIANVMRQSGCEVPQFMLQLNTKRENQRKRKRFNTKTSKIKSSKKVKKVHINEDE